MNPHCESILKQNEDKKITLPAITQSKKLVFKVAGPYSADTIFQKIIEKNLMWWLECIMIKF